MLTRFPTLGGCAVNNRFMVTSADPSGLDQNDYGILIDYAGRVVASGFRHELLTTSEGVRVELLIGSFIVVTIAAYLLQ